uniref:Uncharacterized protein n=1 Tax=Ralstonia syzygii R24 TaxID=907261 RepID=G3A2C2_9RALS|nr:hypothetical protein RALSY_20163 [Ralstonia syzygii R24]
MVLHLKLETKEFLQIPVDSH